MNQGFVYSFVDVVLHELYNNKNALNIDAHYRYL